MVQNRWWNVGEMLRRVHADSGTDSDASPLPSTSNQPHNDNTTAPPVPPNADPRQIVIPGFLEPGTVLQSPPHPVPAIVAEIVSGLADARDQRRSQLNRSVLLRSREPGEAPLMTREQYQEWWSRQSHDAFETFLSTVNVLLTNTFALTHNAQEVTQERDAAVEREREAVDRIGRMKKKLDRERMQWDHSMRDKEREFNQQLEERDTKIMRLNGRLKLMGRLEEQLMECEKTLEIMRVEKKGVTEDGPSTSGSLNLRVPGSGTKRVTDQSDGIVPKSPRFNEDKKE